MFWVWWMMKLNCSMFNCLVDEAQLFCFLHGTWQCSVRSGSSESWSEKRIWWRSLTRLLLNGATACVVLLWKGVFCYLGSLLKWYLKQDVYTRIWFCFWFCFERWCLISCSTCLVFRNGFWVPGVLVRKIQTRDFNIRMRWSLISSLRKQP